MRLHTIVLSFLALTFTRTCVATTLVIVLDRSKSSEVNLGPCKELLPPFLQSVAKDGDQIEVVSFDNRVDFFSFKISASTHDQDLQKVISHIQGIQSFPEETGTDLMSAWNTSAQLVSNATSQPVIVLLVSDGIAQGPSTLSSYTAIPKATSVYLIGYTDPDRVLIKSLTEMNIVPATVTSAALPIILNQELAPRLQSPPKAPDPPVATPAVVKPAELSVWEKVKARAVSFGMSIATFIGLLVIGLAVLIAIVAKIYNYIVNPDESESATAIASPSPTLTVTTTHSNKVAKPVTVQFDEHGYCYLGDVTADMHAVHVYGAKGSVTLVRSERDFTYTAQGNLDSISFVQYGSEVSALEPLVTSLPLGIRFSNDLFVEVSL